MHGDARTCGPAAGERRSTAVVAGDIDRRLLDGAVRDRQPASRADRLQRAAYQQSGALQGAADLRECPVGAAANVHVQSRHAQACGGLPGGGLFELLVPDAVLGLLAAGVGLLAVAVPKAGLIRSVTSRPGARSPSWSSMSGEPQLTWMCAAPRNRAIPCRTGRPCTRPGRVRPSGHSRVQGPADSPVLTASTSTPCRRPGREWRCSSRPSGRSEWSRRL